MDDELLIAYFKGEVSDEEAQQITEWIEAKIEHQRYYQQLCRLFEVSYWIEDIPEQTEVVFPKKTKDPPVETLCHIFHESSSYLCAGFCLALLFELAENNPPRITTPNSCTNRQHVEIMLADGSKVWLNSGSTLTFPSKFNGKNAW